MREGREREDMIIRYYSSVYSLILLPALTCTLIKFPMPSLLADVKPYWTTEVFFIKHKTER